MPTARYIQGNRWWEIKWPSRISRSRTLTFRTGRVGVSKADSRFTHTFHTRQAARIIAYHRINHRVLSGWLLATDIPLQLTNLATTHESEDTEEESTSELSIDLYGHGPATHIDEDDDEETTSTESSSSSSSESSIPRHPITITNISYSSGQLELIGNSQSVPCQQGDVVGVGHDGMFQVEHLWRGIIRPAGEFIVTNVIATRHTSENFWTLQISLVPTSAAPRQENLIRQSGLGTLRVDREMNLESAKEQAVLRYSQLGNSTSQSDLWDQLAADFPKQNERRELIAKIQAARRDRLETEERLRRVRELENVELEQREIAQAEAVLKRAAERATANGAFERRKRRISLQDE